MSQHERGLLLRLVGGVWALIDGSRRFVVNVIFLLLVILVVRAILTSAPALKPRTTLVLSIDGALVEQYTSDPGSRALAKALGEQEPEVQLRDLLRVIAAAKDDAHIERILLRVDGMTGGGFAALREVAAALREFRAAGKQIVAYGDSFDQRQYLLAATADEIWLHPSGGVLLEGLARYQPYFREGLQDKLGVDVHLFRVGEYKSAAEPFVLDAPSAEARAADLHWMNDIWQRYLADIGKDRGLSPEAIAADIERLPERVAAAKGDLAVMARDAHLVDGLKTEDEVRDLLRERGVPDDEEGGDFRQIDFDGYLAHLQRRAPMIRERDTVAVVVAQGEITDGEQAPGTVGGVSTANLIRQAREDEHVKALVLRVDSPGGGVFPSEQIRREIELTRAADIPVVVSMGNVAASGGYWISMNANRIYADESTITGSIGIFGLWFNLPRTLEKIGVRTGGVGTTRFAGAFDPTRTFDPAVGAIVQSVIEAGYADFIGKVAEARGRSEAEIDAIARGRVWSGAQARELGLVDAFGGLRDAIAGARELAKLDPKRSQVRYIEAEMTPFERFMAGLGADARARTLLRVTGLAKVLLESDARQVDARLAVLAGAHRRPLQAYAHCFCGL